MPTRFQLHVADWQDCRRCSLHATRKHTVLVRGQVPCDVLLVGEAPGLSEDVTGEPFDGPAGALLDKILVRAVPGGAYHCAACRLDVTRQVKALPPGRNGPLAYQGCPECGAAALASTPGPRVAVTNLVACIPVDPATGKKAVEPDLEEIRACAPRLQQLYDLCQPRLLVCIGSQARDWLDPKVFPPLFKLRPGQEQCHIQHPAAILRMPSAGKGLAVKRCIVTLAAALRALTAPVPAVNAF